MWGVWTSEFSLPQKHAGRPSVAGKEEEEELFGRTIKVSIAKENGRTAEFIRRKTYRDKTRCYECGEFGHLSFHCPKNMLGDRALPEKKKRKRKKSEVDGEPSGSGATAMEPESDGEEEDDWSLGQAIRHCQYMREREESQSHSGSAESHSHTDGRQRKQLKPDSYFSDEDASD
jgi:U11/U12 small nuclear ribonucleoprotein SNRNP31